MDATQSKGSEALKIKGDWAIQSKQLEDKFPRLTDTDLKFESGKEHELPGFVETRLSKKGEEVTGIISKNAEQKA
ncbi:MAG: hypothetical protein ACXVPQ_01845 [Bacteroidia bacterium]